MTDISETLAPKSDQLDNIDLVDGPRTFTVTRVDVNLRAEQPVSVHLAEFPRPWRPGVNMRRVLKHYWSADSSTWVGRRVTLFRDPEVTYGKNKPGGTRISHLSDMATTTPAPVMLSQGHMGTYAVKPLADQPAERPAERPAEPLGDRITKAVGWFAGQGVDVAKLEAHVALPRAEWTEATLRTLQDDREQIVGGAA